MFSLFFFKNCFIIIIASIYDKKKISIFLFHGQKIISNQLIYTLKDTLKNICFKSLKYLKCQRQCVVNLI
jgi:hypothetical protein